MYFASPGGIYVLRLDFLILLLNAYYAYLPNFGVYGQCP